MRFLTSMIALLLLAAGMALAQGFGGMGSAGGNTVMVNTPKGLFTLRNGVLARYNATSLKLEQELQLFGPAPTAPADFTDRAAVQKYFTDMQQRMAPAIMFARENSLILVVGDGFARINQETLKPEATTKLAAATAPDPNAQGNRTTEPTPGYLAVENILFLMRGKEIMSINMQDGKIVARASLPQELQTLQFNRFGGGGRTGGGGGGNNRGGGQ